MALLPVVLAVLAIPPGVARYQDKPDAKAAFSTEKLADLETVLGLLMDEHHILGMSAAVVHERKLVWSKGFGFADLEQGVPAEPSTRYFLASVSKPFAAVLVMQQVEQGKLSLDAPMKDFRIYHWFAPDPKRYGEQPITVRHVLSHTSESVPPGDAYAYNGNTYFDLTWVLEDVTREAYPRLLQERIFGPAGMDRSVSGITRAGSTEIVELTQPYRWDGKEHVLGSWDMIDPDPAVRLDARFEPVIRMPDEVLAARKELLGERFVHLNAGNSAGEVVSTVLDLAKFDIALDEGRLISAKNQSLMFTPAVSSSGKVLPYALGWFVEEFGGRQVIWHNGLLPPSESALWVKVPAAELSFVLLANNDRLSKPFDWASKGVRASPFARAFLEVFGLLGE